MTNFYFLLIVAGLLLIYCEFIWVGRVMFGVAGAICALAGLAGFCRMPHTSPVGPVLILLAVVCCAVEASLQTFCLAGTAASILWAAGFWKLSVLPQIAFPVSAAFGALTIWLLSLAKQARRNKRST